MAKRDNYENTFRTIEAALGSSSGKNPAGVALGRPTELKSGKARAKKFAADQTLAAESTPKTDGENKNQKSSA
jgi:hypothetical protein